MKGRGKKLGARRRKKKIKYNTPTGGGKIDGAQQLGKKKVMVKDRTSEKKTKEPDIATKGENTEGFSPA